MISQQQSRVSGFTHNCKQEQLVIHAVIAAESIADEHVTLPTQPGQAALVISQADQSIRYRVTDACTDTGTCSCPQGTMGYLCQHRVKVTALATQCSKPDMVLFLGTWAGSERGGLSQLLQRNTSAAQPEPDSWSQLAETFELEAEVQEHEQSISIPAISRPRATTAVVSATQLMCSMPNEADLQSQLQMLLEQSRDNGDMRNILASKLNQAEGAFQQLIACNLAGLRQPARAIEKVQNGLPDSKVKMKSAQEGLTKGHHKTKQAVPTSVIDVSALHPVMPLPKPKPSSKKRSFNEVLSKHDNKEDAPASQQHYNAAVDTTSAATAASNATASAVPVRAGKSEAAGKAGKPSQTVRLPRCGYCASCLKPKSKQACTASVDERAALKPSQH